MHSEGDIMDDKNTLTFENKRIRTVWNEEEQERYFAIVDVVGTLTDSSNPKKHLKKICKHDLSLGNYIRTHCPQVKVPGKNGKKKKTRTGSTEHLLHIIQSIPSPKTESFKLWLVAFRRTGVTNKNKLTLNSQINDTDYYKQISDIVSRVRKHPKRQSDSAIVMTHYEIGRMIVEREQQGQKEDHYGENLIKGLSKYLAKKHGKGFSVANLQKVRTFYLVYSQSAGQSLPATFNVSWKHYQTLMQIEDEGARNFYEYETMNRQWSVKQLQRQVGSSLYEHSRFPARRIKLWQ